MRLTQISFSILTTVMLSSCATTTGPERPQQRDTAIVKGHLVSTLENVLIPIGTKTNLKIKSVNGEEKWSVWNGYADEVQLSTGKHNLTLLCFGTVDRVRFSYEMPFTIDAKAGATYQLNPMLSASSCQVSLVETNEQVK